MKLKSIPVFKQMNCMGCIPIEAVCFFYGIISCVLSLFGLVFLTLARIFIAAADNREIMAERYSQDSFEDIFGVGYETVTQPIPLYEALPLTNYAIILYVCYSGSFAFSLLLCYGTYKRSPTCLQVYMMYGIIMATLMFLALFYLYAWLYSPVEAYIMALAVCINLTVLRVVHKTHQMFREERSCHLALLRGYQE